MHTCTPISYSVRTIQQFTSRVRVFFFFCTAANRYCRLTWSFFFCFFAFNPMLVRLGPYTLNCCRPAPNWQRESFLAFPSHWKCRNSVSYEAEVWKIICLQTSEVPKHTWRVFPVFCDVMSRSKMMGSLAWLQCMQCVRIFAFTKTITSVHVYTQFFILCNLHPPTLFRTVYDRLPGLIL